MSSPHLAPSGAAPANEPTARGTAEASRQRRLAWLRYPLRAVVLGAAAGALAWPLTDLVGVLAMLLAVGVGIGLGERAGRSPYRGWVVAASGFAVFVAFSLASLLVTRFEWLGAALGAGLALRVGTALRLFGWTLAATGSLRALVVRRPTAIVLELALGVASLAFLFASHRGGVVARPLWLGDWSYRAGYDPAVVLLVVGGIAFVILAVSLAVENGRRTSTFTLVVVPLLALLLVESMDIEHLSRLPRRSDRDAPITAHGERSRNPLDGRKVDAGDSGRSKGDGTGSQGDGQRGKDDQGDGQRGTGSQGDGQRGKDHQGDGQRGKDDPSGSGSEQGERPSERSDGGQGQGEDDAAANEPPPPSEDIEQPPPPDSPANQEPMAIVLLGDDYEPPAELFYLRQETWSQYAEKRLVATTRPDADRDVPSEFPTRRVEVPDAPPEAHRKRIRATVAVVVKHRKPFALETPVLFDTATNPDPRRFSRAFRFEALAQSTPHAGLVASAAGNPAWSEELREYYLRPPLDPRYADFAKELTSKLDARRRDAPFMKALAIKLWMDEHLTYSTRHRHAGVPDPTADFLFGDRTGYCVHFAHAAVYLWRTLGIPARVGVGYAVNAESREGSALMVKSGDAHAWPELYLEGAGWVVLDIAPKKNIDPPPRPVDKELQRKLAELARKPDESRPKGAEPRPLEVTSKLKIPWRRVLLALLVSALVVLYGLKLWRLVVPRFARPAALPRVGYRAALDRLAEVGVVRADGETREAFSRRIACEFPSFETLTSLHIADQFADPSRPDATRRERERTAWLEGLARLGEERRPRFVGYRGALRRINPASFLASK
ncbi:MAG: hypothetical protein FJ096_12995 [Deltaproteobacteria bacterium]|nr:hypothetical protein [Deltaproteobacteria bacterium]